MSTQTEALKLALEALTATMSTHGFKDVIDEAHDKAITAIEEALAQPEQQEPKCGAIIEVFGKDWRLEYMSLPVGKHKLYTQQYTYTTPPQPKSEARGLSQSKPLTDTRKAELAGTFFDGTENQLRAIGLINTVETAHGITKEDT